MRLELFYDVVSPWSYLCFEALKRYEQPWHLELVLRPAFLAGVFAATNNAPPISVPARAVYLLHDLARSSRQFHVPLQFPTGFPGNTIAAMRLLTHVAHTAPAQHEQLARALWQAYWQHDRNIADVAVLEAACVEAGLDASALALSSSAEVKAMLRAATDEAVARGAFGFPAMFVAGEHGDELYFGSDRLSQLASEHDLPWSGPAGLSV
jgi:2-hydroxychromene-2-carboxylate isomerase